MYFGYIQTLRARGYIWLSKTFNLLDIPYYLVSVIGPTMAGFRKIVKKEGLRRLENANNGASFLIFSEFTECVGYSLVS